MAKIGGYNSIEHYKKESSVMHRIHLIKRPFFFLSSLDDPFFGPNVIPTNLQLENIILGVTKIGGHTGTMEGFLYPKGLWWRKPCMEFIKFFKN